MELSRRPAALYLCLVLLPAGAYAANDAVTIDSPQQHLFMEVARDGVSVGVMGHGTVDFQPQVVIAGKSRIPLIHGEPSISGTQVTQALGAGITGWYTTGAKGIEQGFTFAKPLGGDHLSIELGVAGRLEPQRWKGSWYFGEMRDPLSTLKYDDFMAYDATHRRLPVSTAIHEGLLTLTVDARHARYPVTLDPFLTSVPTALSAPTSMDFFETLRTSSDGKVVIVGAPGAHTVGAVYSFIKSGSTWVGPIEILNPVSTPRSNFGYSLALSGDGNTALVGAPFFGTVVGPIVYVYARSGTTWTLASSLATTGSVQAGGDGYGMGNGYALALAMSRDGQTALVGSPYAHGDDGAVYAYHLVGGVWGLLETLPAPAASSKELGALVTLSSGGTTAVVAAPGNKRGVGAVPYLYTYDGSAWSLPAALTTLPAPTTSVNISDMVLSGDGTELIASDQMDGAYTGEAYSYKHGSGGWTGPARLSTAGVPTLAIFGDSVALSEDGNRLVVGAINAASGAGAAYFYVRSGTTWMSPTVLSNPSQGSDVTFGEGSAMSAGGDTLFVGSTSTVFAYATSVDFILNGTVPTGLVAPGSDVTLKFTMGNTDPETTATNVKLHDVLPVGVVYKSSSADGGHCNYVSATGTVTCTLANLAAGKSGAQAWQPSITFETPGTATVLHNDATATADQQLAGVIGMASSFTNDAKPAASNGSLTATSATVASGTVLVTPGFADQKLSYTVMTKPSHGVMTLDSTTGDFTYTSAKGFTGKDSFGFSAGDGIVTSNQASEMVTVTAASSGGGGSSSTGGGGGGLDILVSLGLFSVYLSRRSPTRPKWFT